MDPQSIAGSHSFAHSEARDLAYHEADVFLLCYKISDPTTLFSALEQWAPAVRAVAPDTPIVLVGCQSELRFDHKLTCSDVQINVIQGCVKQSRAHRTFDHISWTV